MEIFGISSNGAKIEGRPMKIGVFGTGGVGGYFGGRLAAAGNDVTFIARGEHLRAIQSGGLVIESAKGDFTISPAKATDDPAQVGKVDLVMLGVKAWQVTDAATAMLPLIGVDTIVLPLQNGVEAYDQLAAVVGAEHVLGGLCRIIAMIVEPGHIRHAGFEPSVAFAEWNNRPSERTASLLTTFLAAGIDTTIPPNFQSALWQKFLFISGYGGIGAVTRMSAGVIRAIPETRALIEAAMDEVNVVAAARGILLSEDAVASAMAGVDSLPKDGSSSMQRDIMAGRPSELEAKNGAVVRLGRDSGIPTPINTFVYQCLLPGELVARGQFRVGEES
jgi:2-dehydropantoate 2-reductase